MWSMGFVWLVCCLNDCLIGWYLYVCLFDLFDCLFYCLSVYFIVCLFILLFLCVFYCLSVYFIVCLFYCLFILLFVYFIVCLIYFCSLGVCSWRGDGGHAWTLMTLISSTRHAATLINLTTDEDKRPHAQATGRGQAEVSGRGQQVSGRSGVSE